MGSRSPSKLEGVPEGRGVCQKGRKSRKSKKGQKGALRSFKDPKDFKALREKVGRR